MQKLSDSTILTYEDALHLFAGTGPSYAGGLSNHGPMAVEALVHLGMPQWIGPFVEHYRTRLDTPTSPPAGAPAAWRPWVQRELANLVANAGNLAGHGLLRVAHAVRGTERAEAEGSVAIAHRRELAAAINYWRSGGDGVPGPVELTGSLSAEEWLDSFGRLQPDQRSDGLLTVTLLTASQTDQFSARVASLAPATDPTITFDRLGTAAAQAFSQNVGTNAFALLHGTTVSAMASVLLPLLDQTGRRRLEAAVAAFVAAALVGFDEPDHSHEGCADEIASADDLAEAAAATKEDHTIKFVDACLSIAARTGTDATLPAAQRQITNPYGL